MTSETLNLRSRKILAGMARRLGIAGWHSMTKPELVRALLRQSRAKATTTRSTSRIRTTAVAPRANGTAKKSARNGHRRADRLPALPARSRDLSTGAAEGRNGASRRNYLDASAADAHWIRVQWDLTRDTIRRAETRLGADWHTAYPALRVLTVTADDINNVGEAVVRDVAIEAGVNSWYVHVPLEIRTCRLHIGYKTRSGQFFALAKSNVCSLPLPNARLPQRTNGHAVERGDAAEIVDAGDNIGGGRLGRPLGFSTLSHFGPAATEERQRGDFAFTLDTELIVHGTTAPGSVLTVQGDHIELRDDGSFTIRINQPEGRQVVTFTATSPRGSERRMVVLGMERNTKELERQYFDGGHPEVGTE